MSKIDAMMRELGHPENLTGTHYLRVAARTYEQGMRFTKELYPAVARACGTSAARVERCMRHSIETAWERGDLAAQLKYFGYTVDPDKGRPTVSEYVATMARLSREAEGQP